MKFKLISNFQPTGDQPEAIKQLVYGIRDNEKFQTLLGVTGSGKTFTIANLISEINKPVLILSHNKTLAAQLFNEFNNFFPDNAVEYFVSYYDYYQPEAFIPSTGLYIEKDLSINEEIEKYRINTTTSLLSGRKDIIVVASVSCIYGIGNPEEFKNGSFKLKIGDKISRGILLEKLVDALYSRSNNDLEKGKFRITGETIDILPVNTDIAYRVNFFRDEIEEIESFNPMNGNLIDTLTEIHISPANTFIVSKDKASKAIENIQNDLLKRINELKKNNLLIEAKRLEERTNLDIEMIKELGYCSGIENYSRYFEGREAGTRPFCLLDYFPKDFITIIDESHATIPQIKAMYGGDFSRKKNLVEHGFRLPAAMDNRPLKFEEFEKINNQTIFVSATPSDYEINKSDGVIVEQIIRPTGLLEPKISIRPTKNQIDDLIKEIELRSEKDERILITTLTKVMAEKLSVYFSEYKIKSKYIHSDVDTLERVEIIHELRSGVFDVLIGVNLLREGLDLPEVSLVAILDADKEGFLRSERALTQIGGRAARNINGLVIMYADNITDSMKRTINETERKRKKQIKYNKDYNIKPTTINKKESNTLIRGNQKFDEKQKNITSYENQFSELNTQELKNLIKKEKNKMQRAAKELNFDEAIKIRDKINFLKSQLKN